MDASSYLFNYANVLVFALVGIGFIFFTLLIGSLVRPHVPTLEKYTIYECGEAPIGSAWMNFNIRFYIIALIFVVFDVEAAFMFPIAKVFLEQIKIQGGALVLAEIFAFIGILLVGFAYAWVKGDLDWVKKVAREIREESAQAPV